MSDFAGLWHLDDRPIEKADVDRLVQGLDGRGIAAARIWRTPAFVVVHRQHVFTPEDAFERMPCAGTDGAVLAGDIRLDERAGLAAMLDVPGDLAAIPDSRLVLRALEKWGIDALAQLYGDWSLALWAAGDRRLLLARDAQISRTLFFHRGPRMVAFATRLRPLLSLPEIPLDIDELAVADRLILNHGVPERTHYKAIDRVPQGHAVVLTATDTRSVRWWSMPEPGSLRLADRRERIDAAIDVVDRAVAGALRSVGPVGSCLTGGLDSTAVTLAALHRSLPGKFFAVTRVPCGPLPAPTATRYYDETSRVAAFKSLHPALEWHRVGDDGGDWGEHDATRWFLEAGLPPNNLANWAWFYPLFRFAARQRARVLLTGDYGNFFFSSDGGTAELALLRQGRLLEAWRLLRARGRHSGEGALRAARRWIIGPYLPLRWHNWRNGHPAAAWGFFAALDPVFAARSRMHRRLDLGRYKARAGIRLPSIRQSRAWMLQDEAVCDWYVNARALHGIDLRAPLASRRVIEFFGALPLENFIEEGVPRSLARAVLAGQVPDEMLVSRAGGIQFGDWFSQLSARRSAMLAAMPRLRASALAGSMVDLDRLQRLIDDWPTDIEAAEARRLDYTFVLTRGLDTAEFLAWRDGANR